MATLPEILPETTMRVKRPPRKRAGAAPVLKPWLRAQSINVTRHAAALRPFRREEFGTGAAAPTEGHIQAANKLIGALRHKLLRVSKHVANAIGTAIEQPAAARLRRVAERKDRAHKWVQGIEKI